ncbi:MAG TPA: DUF4177 domain-containing protein [Cellvibrio sp.]|nr:DUF4177 domain-containing protein [Cellvibrio sp.]
MKFEYKTLKFTLPTSAWIPSGDVNADELDVELNKLGELGWDLVSAVTTNVGAGGSKLIVAIFKRAVSA